MKIVVDNQDFLSIREFTDYLNTHYEQNELAVQVNLSIACEEIDRAQLNELAQFLLNSAKIYVLKLLPLNRSYQPILNDAYLANKRRKFSRDVQEHLARLDDVIPHLSHIRQSKKSWLAKTQSSSLSIQVRHQSQNFLHKTTLKVVKRVIKQHTLSALEFSPVYSASLPQEHAKEPYLNVFEQFLFHQEHATNPEQYEIHLVQLMDEEATVEASKLALLFFLKGYAGEEQLTLIRKLLDALPLTSINYRGLAYVLIHSGADGILLLLNQLHSLKNEGFFNHFNEMFLDKPEDYEQLVTLESLTQLHQLSQLNPEQQSWWFSLVSQHKRSGAPTEFSDLFAAFSNFITSLEDNNGFVA